MTPFVSKLNRTVGGAMKLGASTRTPIAVGLLALTIPALTATGAFARAVDRQAAGRLAGYPVLRGVVPVLGSASAVQARRSLIDEAFAAAHARQSARLKGVPVPNEGELERCLEREEEELALLTQDMCYHGGPILRDPKIHLIFWQGQVEEDVSKEPNVKLFPPRYVELVSDYFEDVAHDSGRETNVFAVDPQYWEEQSGNPFNAGEYKLSFDRNADVTVDTTRAFPKHVSGCSDPTEFSEGPCLLDSDLQKEVEEVAGTSSKGLGDLYVVLTPPGVGGCFETASGECAYRQYCAYHGDFGGNGITAGLQTIYADLPYLGEVPGCDSFVHPNEVVGEKEEEEGRDRGADAVIDTASHEINEAITDPIGSQCDEEEIAGKAVIVGCERLAWTDAIGQEVADKCLPPESTVFGVYGEPLGQLLPGRGASLFNQEINEDKYWTQREWSNEAGLGEGACVQRRIQASFSVPAQRQATVPMTLDGSSSGAPGDPAVYWVWNFGGGEQVGTASPTISHSFPTPGIYAVGLTAYDAYGNSEAGIGVFEVGAAPPPTPPAAPVVIKETIVPGRYSAAQVAAALGLPARAAKLSGFGPFSLGHAQCPPACGVVVQLYARESKVSRKHRTSKWVLVGSARLTLAAKSTASLAVKLNAKGKSLLRKERSTAARLIVTVEGQEGGSWQIARSLTLKL